MGVRRSSSFPRRSAPPLSATHSLLYRWLLGWLVGCLLCCGCSPTSNGTSSNKQSSSDSASTNANQAVAPESSQNKPKTDGASITPPAGNGSTKPSTLLAKEILAESFQRYRSLKRYEDQGQLVIRGTSTLTLPLQVAWEFPNRLALRTGALEGMWSSESWEALSMGNPNPFPGQRLVRPLPDRIDLAWTTDDPLGGLTIDPLTKPIQLELILSSELSEALNGVDTKLVRLEQAAFDGVECERVQVEKRYQGDYLKWVFWVDPKSKLFLKIELPPQFYYPGGEGLDSSVSCAMELHRAQADSEIDWGPWRLPPPKDELLVSRWVAPPPIASTPVLGQVIPPMDLKGVKEELILDTAEPKRSFSVLLWIADHPTTRALIDDLLEVRRKLIASELSGASSLYLIASADEAKGLVDKLRSWNCDLPLVVDRDNKLQQAFQVPQAPALLILDRNRRVQVSEFVISPKTIASLPELVGRLNDAQDLASRQLQQDADNQSRYIAALHRVAIDKDQAAKLPPIREFQFSTYGMRRDWKVEFTSPLVSAGGAWYPDRALSEGISKLAPNGIVMAGLDEDGGVHAVQLDGTVRLCAKIDTEQADGAKRIATTIDPWSHQWIGIVPEGLPRFWVCPAGPANDPAGPATTYNTQESETPTCYAWITSATGKPTASIDQIAIAIGTTASRLLMVEPKSEKRLDAVYRENAIALVPGLTADGLVDEWDVLFADGSLHKIANLIGDKIGRAHV